MSWLTKFGAWSQGVGQRLGVVGEKTMGEVTKFISPQYAAQVEANKANRELAEYSYGKDLEMWQRQQDKNLQLWNLQNQYNSPQAQMQRYQDAGLNPNLIYGQSNTASPVSSTQMPKYNAPDIKAAPLDLPDRMQQALQMGMSVLNSFQDLRVKKASEDNLLQDVINKQTINAANALGVAEKTEHSKYFAQAAKAQLDSQLMNIRKLAAETRNLGQQFELNREALDLKKWEKELRTTTGVSPNSSDFVSSLIRSLYTVGSNLVPKIKLR